jgi:hypothetical protein
MEVLARIPHLQCPAVAVGVKKGVEAPCQAETAGSPCQAEFSAAPLPEAAVSAPPAPCPVVSLGSPPRGGAGRRRQAARFPGVSIVILTAVAAAIWAAAWRNDRLRWEAGRQQPPERLAQELPATAGAERSRTP